MADNLQNFISSVRNIGIARTNRYEAQIFFPNSVQPSSNDIFRLFCTRINIPDISVDTAEILIYGEQRVIPYRPRYSPASISFYMDNDFNIKKTFDKWMAQVSDPIGRTIGYYDNYKGSIQIDVLPVSEDQKSYSVYLEEAYPKSLENISLDHTSKGPMIFTLQINYKYYKLVSDEKNNMNFSLNNDALSVNTYTGLPTDYTDQINWQLPTFKK